MSKQYNCSILIESHRLILKQLLPEHHSFLETIFCDPKMMFFLGESWKPNQVTEALQEWHQEWGKDNRWFGMLIRKDNHLPIGTAGIALNTIEDEPGYELSWFILPEYQNSGYASEITLRLIKFVFNELQGKRILAETHPHNPASNHLLKKLGFKNLGERHHNYEDLPGFDTQVLWEKLSTV